MKNKTIIIGSRGSELALWQANFVLEQLKNTGTAATIKIINTKGDLTQHLSWNKMEGKGFFTKEIEDALLKKEIDLAVHSHKDLPTESNKELIIAAVSQREDPSELLLIHKSAVDEKSKFSLKQNAVVGTSSARRKSQLLAWRSDLQLVDLRGNVPTRIQKLREKKYDAILIANAGVSRLETNVSEFHSEKLDPREFIPAPAQGVLALQIRQSDKKLWEELQKINDPETAEIISVERKIMNLFQGGCQLPLGVYCNGESIPDMEEEKIFKVSIALAENMPTGKSAWKFFPKYFYLESKKSDGLAEKIVAGIKAEKPARVFISRKEKKNDFFKNCLQAHGYSVFCHSLIEINPIPFNKNLQADWIFFSSKNAVKYFFEQKPRTDGMKIGAVGKATAEEIRKYGKRADFIGSSEDTRMTGKKFSALAGNKKVLFPQAKQSMKTIQLQMPQSHVIDLVVYETIKHNDLLLPTTAHSWHTFQLLVFTSPSNVDAFFEKNNITASQKVIAMGDATANALRKYGVKPRKQPPTFNDLGLVQAVMSLN